MDILSLDQLSERECTPKCRSHHHAQQILSCTTKGTPSEVRSYCMRLCFNFSAVVDEFGRNLLHLAASCGKWEVVEWLLDHCHCDVDVRDAESGWTALHRSFFYGQLTVARVLLSHGANLRMTDHESLTPLDLLIKDRPPHVEYLAGNPLEVYMWGSNTNFNLGLGNEQSRKHPEILDFFRRECISIKQVVVCKFHTVFLSNGGKVFTCGHGHGGRLGQGSENTGLVPSLVHGLETISCEQVASGQDHLVLLMEGGQVWTCGLNLYYQLGHSPPPERLLCPKPLVLKLLKGMKVIGVCAARFHSVFYTTNSIFTFGLNAGQLGHPKDEHCQILPRHVSSLYKEDWKITHVVASDGATVCATDRGDVYVLHEYQQRKIASLKQEIKKISVVGGHLDYHCDVATVTDKGGLELRILILTKVGKVFLWRQSNPFLTRCIFSSGRQLIVSDLYLNHYTVALVTHENEGFLGDILPHKNRKSSTEGAPLSPALKAQSSYGQFNPLLNREECDLIRIKRILHVHRATSIVCDSKGRNFAVLQSSPKMGLVDIPVIPEPEMQRSMLRLLNESTLDDTFHDVIIKIGAKQYPAHKYILASRSKYFRKLFQTDEGHSFSKTTVTLQHIKPEAFEQVLKFIYCNSCDLLTEGYEVISGKEIAPNLDHCNFADINESNNQHLSKKHLSKEKFAAKKKNQSVFSYGNFFKSVQEASRCLNVAMLAKILEEVKVINGKIRLTDSIHLPKLAFDRSEMTDLCDVKLKSKDGVEFPCHRSILVARLDYFNSMFRFNWMEASSLESLPLDISSEVIDVILDFLYTDDALKIIDSEDPDFLCTVLVTADEMFIERLKEMCEVALVGLLTLKNAPEILHIASVCNAVQLKRSCLEYICINLPAIVELKNLDILSEEVMNELNDSYRNLISSMCRRYITPSPYSPTKSELKDVEQLYPVNKNSDVIRYRLESLVTKGHDGKGKGRRRTYSNRGEQKDTVEVQKQHVASTTKDVIFNITVDSKDHCIVQERKINEKKSSYSSKIMVTKKLSETSPISGDFPELNTIVIEGKTGHKAVNKTPGIPGEMRKLSHLSQKQKKLLAAASKDQVNSLASSLSSQSLSSMGSQRNKLTPSCPWAKLNSEEPRTMSFWDTNASEKIQSPNNANSTVNQQPAPINPWIRNRTEDQKDVALFVSLKAIQQAEEEKQCAVNPKIKSLQLINIEDQAIEELLMMYKAAGNPNEKVTVSRILPEKVARPVWRKRA